MTNQDGVDTAELRAYTGPGPFVPGSVFRTILAAADEIDRLRQRESKWQAEFAHLNRVCNEQAAYAARVAGDAAHQALEEVLVEILKLTPINCELRPDGSEDKMLAQWVLGVHDAHDAVLDLVARADQENHR